jgi:hypothetical protein
MVALLFSGDLSGGTLEGVFTGLLDIVDLAISEKRLDGQKTDRYVRVITTGRTS